MQDKLRVLADWLQVNPDVLRFGRPTAAPVEKGLDGEERALNLQDREMLSRYLQLPTESKKTARDVIAALWIAIQDRRLR